MLLKQVKNINMKSWATTVSNDLKQLKINLSFDAIARQSKSGFKIIVKKAIHQAAFNYLCNLKSKLSKGSEIHYSEFKTQNYLLPGNGLTLDCMRSIFQIRSRSLALKCNFSSQYPDTNCIVKICSGSDSQRHIYDCLYLNQHNDILMMSDIKYDDIFTDNVYKQTVVMRILINSYNYRQQIISSQQAD